MASKFKWHKGPPPYIGWWNASSGRCSTHWRWWDGKQWSVIVFSKEPAHLAAAISAYPCAKSQAPFIEWTDYYPANARVPRIAP